MRGMHAGFAGFLPALAFALSGAASAEVSFSGQPLAFQSGSGFGVDAPGVEKFPPPLPRAGEPLAGGQGGTLLDVVFNVNAVPVSFVLPAVGSSLSGVFGTVQLRERFIDAAELDNLGLSATIDFGAPSVGVVTIVGSVTAIPGIVPPLIGEAPGTVDLAIVWTPVDVSFGRGGLFRVSLNSLSFDHVVLPPTGDGTLTLEQRASITLLAAPVPEPSKGALALVGVVILGLYGSRMRPRQAACSLTAGRAEVRRVG